jgi:hypothetical protein
MAGIQHRCRMRNITFDAKKACIRCIPHTIQRAALKVSCLSICCASLTASQILEALGVVSEKEASVANTNYQDIVNAAVNAAIAATHGDEDDANGEIDDADDAVSHSLAAEILRQKTTPLTPVATAVEKVAARLASIVRIICADLMTPSFVPLLRLCAQVLNNVNCGLSSCMPLSSARKLRRAFQNINHTHKQARNVRRSSFWML